MKYIGLAYANGAGTIINAISTWKGAAFGIELKTTAFVELSDTESHISGQIAGMPDANTMLIEKAVKNVLDRFNMELGGTVITESEVPLARGLKSSSAAANAVVLATLDAIGKSLDPIEAIKIGVMAAIDAKVTITGAFDDACASMLGGIVITDNKKQEIIKRIELEKDVLILAPNKKMFSLDTNVYNSKLIAPWVDIAYNLALDGEYENAMVLNGFLYCNALGINSKPIMQALDVGVKGVSLSGTGPSFVAMIEKDKIDALKQVWASCESVSIMHTKINNKSVMDV
ncbi:MAG: shikimate kinase [Methanosarcinaceae archaeon]|nr:shikimate kinase [Methanosarcinaceae archaeon]NKQ39239.1 shikimate kinase [Methanosarcinales archaeon]